MTTSEEFRFSLSLTSIRNSFEKISTRTHLGSAACIGTRLFFFFFFLLFHYSRLVVPFFLQNINIKKSITTYERYSTYRILLWLLLDFQILETSCSGTHLLVDSTIHKCSWSPC